MPTPRDGLLDRLRSRDVTALTAVVTENARPLYRAARVFGFPDDLAQDLVQDVFATFLETLDKFEGRSAVRTWLFGILMRKAKEQRRLDQREEAVDLTDATFDSWFTEAGWWARHPDDPTRGLDEERAAQALADCIGILPPLQREAFHLRAVEELSGATVAAMLGETVNHVGVLLHRARVRLRECLSTRGVGQ